MANDETLTAPVQGIPDEIRKLVEHAASLAIQVKLHPMVGLVEVQTREKFAIRPHVTFLTYDTFEAVYCGILQAKMAARGQAVALEKTAGVS